MDLSHLTDEELKDGLAGFRLALGASLGRPGDGREERKNADLREKIDAYLVELDIRNVSRSPRIGRFVVAEALDDDRDRIVRLAAGWLHWPPVTTIQKLVGRRYAQGIGLLRVVHDVREELDGFKSMGARRTRKSERESPGVPRRRHNLRVLNNTARRAESG